MALVVEMEQQAVRLVEYMHGERQAEGRAMNFQRGREPRRAGNQPDSDLIDVLLVIIIFLMLTTTYSKFSGLEINLPTADASIARLNSRTRSDVANHGQWAGADQQSRRSPLATSRAISRRAAPRCRRWAGGSADRDQCRRQGDASERRRCDAGGANGWLSAYFLRHAAPR
jgi:biopolymer transport protein ExbD